MGRHAVVDTPTRSPRKHPWRLALLGFLVLWLLGTGIGVLRLWPSGEPNISPSFYTTFALGQEQVSGTVVASNPGACHDDQVGRTFEVSPRTSAVGNTDCTWHIVELTSGVDAGKRTLLINTHQPGDPDLSEDDQIRLLVAPAQDGTNVYSFSDYSRGGVLALWTVVVAAAVIMFALWRGLRALIGVAITMVVVVGFTLPAILLGESPTATAVISGAAILIIVVPLVHGLNWKSASALGGTLLSLGIAATLASAAISSTHLRGLGSEENLQLLLYLPDISITGLMLCGFIIGSLGVMNDVTIAQASTVRELATLDPDASPWRLVMGAMAVGRDHISSMVYTLVLSYTGASLPMLLMLSVANRPLLQTLTSDIMATELLRSGIGALALTLAVPLTTIIAAFTVPSREVVAAATESSDTPSTE